MAGRTTRANGIASSTSRSVPFSLTDDISTMPTTTIHVGITSTTNDGAIMTAHASSTPAPRHCGQLSRNTVIPRVSSLFRATPVARPLPVAYGADRPRAPVARPRPSSRTTAVRARPAITVSATPPFGVAHS
ncbi:hypothetical protein [Burkholderia sp. IMCC1007]|uniref:hypothetical protein n=1 Tax=Burkholderia sp. IMCC1007 TaxID=3004104 RepID=UPI0022B37703|nr:hypothetical protein [Burkholderia sp. IMCC1007]